MLILGRAPDSAVRSVPSIRHTHGKWKHKSENLSGLTNKKQARTVLQQRIQESSTHVLRPTELTVRDFVESYWKPYLEPQRREAFDSEGVLYPTLDRLNIPRPKRAAGFHSFRHSAASFVNEETGNLKLAQKLLGHSNLSTTADVYTHTSAEDDRKAALAVERAIYGDLFVNVREIANTNKSAATN